MPLFFNTTFFCHFSNYKTFHSLNGDFARFFILVFLHVKLQFLIILFRFVNLEHICGTGNSKRDTRSQNDNITL